jgi:hypothetical protein
VRIATSLLALLACTSVAFAANPTPTNVLNVDEIELQKQLEGTPGINNPTQINVGGDTIGSAVPIGGIPYSDSGNTCAFVHNYNEICPFSSVGAPDVVYSYTPTADIDITIDLCTSLYDTKVYVYENAVGNVVGCNDDACGNDGWKSLLECVHLTAGNTYYIVVDGYSASDCGTYYMNIIECIPCDVICPPGALAEGEIDCYNNYVDVYNGGCNSTPYVFTPLPCSATGSDVVVCGTYGGFYFNGNSYRDTDWYEINLTAPATITWTVTGELDTIAGVIDGNAGCPVTSFLTYATAGDCIPASVTVNLPAGTWWLFAATYGFGPGVGPCGSEYVATLSGYNCPPVAVEPSSWGATKNLYR